MQEFDISSAHRLVRTQRAMGNDVEWDGWDIVFYRPAEIAMYSTDGVWRPNARTYAFANRVSVDTDGKWRVDPRNIKRPRRAGARPRRN